MIFVNNITINPSTNEMVVGKSTFFHAIVCPKNADNKCVTWSSNNTSVASVNPVSGLVYAHSAGSAIIYATAQDGSGVVGTCGITVINDILIENIDLGSFRLPSNQYSVVPTYITPKNATNQQLIWSSSDNNIATVDSETGVVTGKAVGSTTITARATDGSNKVGSCTVLITTPILATDLQIIPSSKILSVGDTLDLKVEVQPCNTTTSIKWTSNNPEIASVNMLSGEVTANSAGTTQIVATSGENIIKTATIKVDPREKVTLVEDDVSFTVMFASGSIWKYIGQDVETVRGIPIFAEVELRANENAQTWFTMEQLALLYLIDPMGVAYYVKYSLIGRYSLSQLLFFKDALYKKIFGSSPHFFRVFPGGTVTYYTAPDIMTSDFRNGVYSDAELLFGDHPIWDALSITGLATDILKSIFGLIPQISTIQLGIEVGKALFYAAGILKNASSEASTFISAYLSEITGASSKLNAVFTIFDLLYSAVDSFESNIRLTNPKNIIIYHSVQEQPQYRVVYRRNNIDISIKDITDNCVIE